MRQFQKLSETEAELMQVIWECDHPVTSSELLRIFAEEKGKQWKGQTISTFLSRLVDKGVLSAASLLLLQISIEDQQFQPSRVAAQRDGRTGIRISTQARHTGPCLSCL